MITRYRLTLLTIVVFFAGASTAHATIHRVFEGESIQAAIDVAAPGDTILVEPGIYIAADDSRYGLRITTDNLRLIGRVGSDDAERVRIVASDTANSMHETGVFAAPVGCEYDQPLEACDEILEGFYIRGFSVEGFPQNGIQTRWVDDFKLINNESANNLNNGIYPTLSANGLVRNNVSYGSLDTSMWVAGSENVRVVGNELFGSPIGFEITVSNNVLVSNNEIHDNTVGIGLFHPNAAGNGPLPVMKNWIIVNNHVYDNNLENPAPPGSFQAALPLGGGILMLGVSNHTVRGNNIEGNDFFGIGLIGWCVANSVDPDRNCIENPPITDPSARNNDVSSNNLVLNGLNPPLDFPLAPLAADVIYLQTFLAEPGGGNCFQSNTPEGGFTFFSSVPDGELPTTGC